MANVLPLELPDELLIEAMRRLPPARRRDLLNKLQELTKPVLHPVPAAHLDALTNLISLGGDAVEDSERLHDESNDYY